MKEIFPLLLFLFSIQLGAQEIRGRVIDSKSDEALLFVNVGVLNGTRGTVSDEHGNFVLDLGDIPPSHTLRFSLIGYETADYLIKEIKQKCRSNCSIFLKAKDYTLAEVLVTPKDYRERIIGNRIKSKRMQAGFKRIPWATRWAP